MSFSNEVVPSTMKLQFFVASVQCFKRSQDVIVITRYFLFGNTIYSACHSILSRRGGRLASECKTKRMEFHGVF